MSEGESTGSNAIWAVALIIIVAMIVGLLIYSRAFTSPQKKEIDVDISVPAR